MQWCAYGVQECGVCLVVVGAVRFPGGAVLVRNHLGNRWGPYNLIPLHTWFLHSRFVSPSHPENCLFPLGRPNHGFSFLMVSPLFKGKRCTFTSTQSLASHVCLPGQLSLVAFQAFGPTSTSDHDPRRGAKNAMVRTRFQNVVSAW